MNQVEFLIKAREWQNNNPEWQLICDMKETDSLYVQFGEMPAKERMHWVGKFGEDAVKAFNEFATKQCKVKRMFLNEKMELVSVWPKGCAMTCFLTGLEYPPFKWKDSKMQVWNPDAIVKVNCKKETDEDPFESQVCPPGCECPSDKGCGIV